MNRAEKRVWDQRLRDVLACRDNDFIPRHPQAGRVKKGILTMHNGIQIHSGSYYGWGSQRVLTRNKGCHEPQEERAFAHLLEQLGPNSTMLELGAYWSFYSLWFAIQIKGARNWMVEPDPGNLKKGQANFELNHQHGNFIHAFVSDRHNLKEDPPLLSVDGFMEEQNLEQLTLLHSDIQGYELQMLQGAAQSLTQKKIDHLFISTHSNALHDQCVQWLRDHDYLIRHDIDLDHSFSHDGLIVAQSPGTDIIPSLPLHLRNQTAR